VSALADAVSPYVGLVRSVDERLVDTADAQLPVFTTELADDARLLGSPLTHIGVASGMGIGRDGARAAALGEAVERYALTCVPRERLRRATAAQLGPAAVEPAEFALFADDQYARDRFPFSRFTADTAVWWIDGRSLSTGEPAWLPAELVFLADVVRPGEQRIGYATSSGAACAPTPEEATLRGLFELCERDAVMILWAARLELPLLDWSDDAELCALEARYFAPSGLSYAAVDLSDFHGIPSVLGVVRSTDGADAALGVGAGTDATVRSAWWKALAEAFGTRTSASHRRRAGEGTNFDPDGANVLTVDDHIVFHADPERGALSAFLDRSPRRRRLDEVPALPPSTDERLAFVVDAIATAGSGAFVVDVTAPDVRALGLHVVKAVAPGLCPLDVPHSARFLGAQRLRSVPAARGIVVDELNPDPHPFP
jgi:ribosomal protein S12 methylthiotransferase accessory factor